MMISEDDESDPQAVVGWMVVLDMTAVCVECAATEEAVRRIWGAGPHDAELVSVGQVALPLARALGFECQRCGRRLADVRRPKN